MKVYADRPGTGLRQVMSDLIGVAGWLAADEPVIATSCVIAADFVAALMMLPKTWRQPGSETLATYVFASLGGAATVGAVGVLSVPLLIYPVYFILVTAGLAGVIVYRTGYLQRHRRVAVGPVGQRVGQQEVAVGSRDEMEIRCGACGHHYASLYEREDATCPVCGRLVSPEALARARFRFTSRPATDEEIRSVGLDPVTLRTGSGALHLDASPGGEDWIKRGAWDLHGVDDVETLRAYLAQTGMTAEEFKKLPVYQGNVSRLPWLRDL